MSIFDKVKKGMIDSTKTIKEISSEMTETTRLKVAISKEKAQLEELYYNLGKILYTAYENNINTKELPEVVVTALRVLKETNTRISEYEQRIEFLKGILKCKQCGWEVEEDARFCSNCGNKLTFILYKSVEESPVSEDSLEETEAVECDTLDEDNSEDEDEE